MTTGRNVGQCGIERKKGVFFHTAEVPSISTPRREQSCVQRKRERES